MEGILNKIEQATTSEIVFFLNAVLERYAELFPEWEISTVSIDKTLDRAEQIDRVISVLQNIRSASG